MRLKMTLRGCAALALVLTLALGACGDDAQTNDTDTTNNNDVTFPTDTPPAGDAQGPTDTVSPEDTNVANPCEPNPCLNGGTCADDGAGNAACTCVDGYTGDTCETAPVVDPCDPNPCLNGGTCADDGAGNAVCTCVDGYTGDTCETAPVVDPCDPNPCLNGGTCADDGAGNAVCTCAEGFEGDLCADAIPLSDIVDTAIAAGTFTTLVTAIEAAELIETLKGDGPFTVLAPTDDAFAALEEGVLDAALADAKGLLTEILTYHVASGKAMAADVVGLSEIETLNGKKITVEVVDDAVILNGSVKVTATDIECSNGVIHVIDAVLIPLDDIIETATATGDFTTMLTAVEAAGYTETFKGDGPYTVFAPTDDAFAALDPEVLQAALADPEGLLSEVLTYHAANGKVMAAAVVGLQEIKTLNGKVITVEVVDGAVVLNGTVNVTATDIECSNGVIHVIDAVLLPPVQLCEADMGPCDIGSEPNNGLVCVIGWGGQGMCRRSCTDLDVANCLEGEGCITGGQGGPGFCGLTTCNGLFTDDCGPGATCVMVDGLGTCYVAGDKAEGEACESLVGCQMQLLCVGSECQSPPCSTDGIKTCPSEDELCQAYTVGGGFPLDVGECILPCKSFVDDPMCTEDEWCVPFWMDALNGQCMEIDENGLPEGAPCGQAAGGALCGPDMICVGTCEYLCKVEAGLGEVGGCGEMEMCLGLNSEQQGALDIGICNAVCDYHGGVGCPSDDDFCSPKELVGEGNDVCLTKPNFWPMEYGASCTPEMEYNFCAPGAFCFGGTCTKACFTSEGDFADGHPDCQNAGGPTECVDVGFGAAFGLCQ